MKWKYLQNLVVTEPSRISCVQETKLDTLSEVLCYNL